MGIEELIEHSNLIEGVTGQREVTQSLGAWSYLLGATSLSEDVVLTTHRLIMRHFPVIGPGKLRQGWVTVGGRTCPSPEMVPYLLENWVHDMSHYVQLDPKEMHVRFEKIHPFRDGNGRCGRMLMWWHEMRLRRELTLIKYEDRHDYYNWFDES